MKGFDVLGFIMDYESEGDNLTQEDIINGFQHMLDSGLIWQLQGSYQRMAYTLLDAGLIHGALAELTSGEPDNG